MSKYGRPSAEEHSEMLEKRKGHPIDYFLRHGVFRPAGVFAYYGKFHFLELMDHEGRKVGCIAITADEAADPRFEGLMLS